VLPGAVVAGDRPAAHRPGRDVQVVAAAGRQGGHRDRLGHTHGNVGYSAESPLQQRYRDVASYLVADGTAAIQKRIIATSLLGNVAAQ
jgi:alkylation response protein AidB-like acyl-CoA dehydrogenase